MLHETIPMIIDGKRCVASNDDLLDATDPATGDVVARFPNATPEDVDRAVTSARSAFDDWRRTDPAQRSAALTALAEQIAAHADELSMLDVMDNGSPIKEMRNDAGAAIAQLRYFAGLILQLRGDTVPGSWNRVNYVLRQPYGVCVRIIPFNHPLVFAAAKIAAPVAAGNTVIVKPSEHTSLSALRLAELIAEVFPPGVITILPGTGATTGDALVTHRDVRRIAFIGSAATGRAILRRANENRLKTVSLELGGKNPLVVFPDADIDDAVSAAVRGMNFTWQGQSCGSTSRLIVHREIYDRFVEQITARIDSLRSGLPQDEQTDVGAIVNRLQYEKVQTYIDIGKAEGARLVVGGQTLDHGEYQNGLFVRPTVFADVDPMSRLAQEEIFGPILAAMRFDNYDDALRIANGVAYGLTAGVFTNDLRTAHAFARDVEAGYVWINDVSRHTPGTPFGGIKDSGLGREEDIEELYSYTEPKNVHIKFDA
jgi:acyl-CoA reductase-like NAD-dependent aldehyde dehydrogenase